MIRYFIILCICTVYFGAIYGQTPDGFKLRTTVLTKTFNSKQKAFQDTVLLRQIGKLRSSNGIAAVDSLFNDTAFLRFVDTSASDHGEFSSVVYTVHIPIRPIGWISDFENIFSKAQISELDSLIGLFERETSNEIVVVTIDSWWTENQTFDDLILRIANEWGVGKKGLNNGVTIGICTGLRRIRICNGYGIETKLSDEETKKIMEYIIIPHFKKGNYFEGTKDGILAIINKIR